MEFRTFILCLAGIIAFSGYLFGLIYNDTRTDEQETKQMVACVESGGQWLEAEGMSSRMECVK